MSKRTVFTTITPIPTGVTREIVMDTLRNHVEMIDLNPLVIDRFPCKAPSFATAEEYHSIWYEIVDRVSYLPVAGASSKVHYHGCFHDLADGLQTHVYAPLGLEIKSRWLLAGNLPGEPAAPVELGLGIPRQGLYLREDVDMKCNIVMTAFVKKTLKKAHSTLVDRLLEKGKIRTVDISNASLVQHGDAASHTSASPAMSFAAPHLDHRASIASSMASQPCAQGSPYAPEGGPYAHEGRPYAREGSPHARAPSPYRPYRSSYGPPVPQKEGQQGYGFVELPAPPAPPKDGEKPINELPG